MEESKEITQEVKQKNQREEMYEKCNKRLALIHSKYPNIQEAPETIQEEASELNGLKVSLTTRNIWGDKEASNGLFIDSFKIKRYEEALANSESLKKENEKYISPKEEKDFEFPEVNLEEIDIAIDNMHSIEDQRKVMNKISELRSGFHSNEQNKKINELYEKWGSAKIKPIEKEESKVEATPPIKQSKFAQIYQKAKGKLRGIVDNLRNRFSKERNAEEKDIQTESEQDNSDEAR